MDQGEDQRRPGAGAHADKTLRRLTLAAIAACLAGLAGCGKSGGQGASPPAQPSAHAPPTTPAPIDAPFSPAETQAMLEVLVHAPEQGFAPGAFGDPGRIASLVASTDPLSQAQGQRRLRTAILKYARAQHGLGLPFDQFPKQWGIRPARYDASLDLRAAQGAHRIPAWLAALPPPDPRYRALVKALAAYRAIARSGGWPELQASGRLGMGDRGHRVQALRDRLAIEDPAAAAAAPNGVFDDALGQAVARFQASHHLDATGEVGPKTWAALNVPVQDRIDQIRANLERWRWLPRELAPNRIEVDAAADTLDAYQGGKDVLHMLAAAGKPDDQTPMLISKITDIELNPPWLIPADIARKEEWPKQHRNHGYFAREQIVRGPSAAAPLMQKAGPKSALGQVKFEFDNAYGVYLHDTPAKSAFSLDEREVSHGCVRLQRALDLAALLLNGVPGWSRAQIDQVVTTNVTQRVNLPQPVPVMLLYWTAYAQNSQAEFGADPYGWDDILVRLLDAAAPGQA
jgi:murein L,D-transpeptidase YcbB/YkuD